MERLVVRAAGEIRVLASLTPARAACERERLAADLRQGRSSLPRWTYAAASHDELRRALDAAQAALGRSDEPQHELYRARMRELSIEAELSRRGWNARCCAADLPNPPRPQREDAPCRSAKPSNVSAVPAAAP